jgi:hypothetical protein
MYITASYNASKLYTLLLAVTVLYQNSLKNVNIELTYGTTKTQNSGFYVSNGPMEVSFEQADLGCTKARSRLFYATESMNITDFFEKNGLESIWTGIFRREDQKLFLDDGGFTPVTMTKTDRIDSSQLVLSTFADDIVRTLNTYISVTVYFNSLIVFNNINLCHNFKNRLFDVIVYIFHLSMPLPGP